MTQKDKNILLKDLCARLPYNFVYCYCNAPFANGKPIVLTPVVISNLMNAAEDLVIKPYLRPMDSMTEEELEEFRTLIFPEASCAYEDCLEWDTQLIGGGYLQISVEDFSNVIDWLNAHHFDYRGLIEKSLAIVAPEEMYKTE